MTVADIPKKIGKYEVIKKLGEGSFGTVYLARDPITRQVAVKVLKADDTNARERIARFIREAKSDLEVRHHGVVVVHEYNDPPGEAPYIVMEYLDGQTLEQRLRSCPQGLPIETVLEIALSVADTLATAHDANVIHRDLKPANIMLVPRKIGQRAAEVTKVVDFGLAQLRNDQSDQDGFQTEIGSSLGTPKYRSPEQALDAADVDGKTDVFALGVTLIHCLLGRLPKSIKNAELELMELRAKHADIADLLAQMIRLDPTLRPEMWDVHARLLRLSENRLSGGVGVLGRALAQSRLPTIARWSEGFERGYACSPPLIDYSDYKRELRAIGAASSDEERLELIINRCVEGETSNALDELGALNIDAWPPHRRAAYHRLRGALLRELGATVAAREAYQESLSVWPARGQAFERAVGFDLLNLDDSKAGQAVELARLRAIEEWPGVLACDHARTQSADAFANESFAAAVGSDGTVRIRTGMREEIGWHNAALALAYLAGDFSEAREARVAFARHIVGQGFSAGDVDLLAIAADELIAARDDSDLEKLLTKKGQLLADKREWDRIACVLRPLEPSGAAAERTWRTVLAIVKTMSPYLGDDARARVTAEMLAVAKRVAGGEEQQMFENYPENTLGFRTSSVFIEAMTALSPLSPEHFGDLLQVLETMNVPPVERRTLWDIVAAREWTPADRAAAEQTLRLLFAHELGDKVEGIVISVCGKIATQFSDLLPQVAEWFFASESRLSDDRWQVFLYKHFPAAAGRIGRWIEGVISEECADLSARGARDGYRISGWTRAMMIGPAYEHYPEQFSGTERAGQLTRLLGASANPHIYTGRKAAVFSAISRAVIASPSVDLASLREALSKRAPGEEQSRGSRGPSLGEASPIVAQLRLLELWLRLGVAVGPSELLLLMNGLMAEGAGTRVTAVKVAAVAARMGSWRDQLAAMLVFALQDRSTAVRATAAYHGWSAGIFGFAPFANAALERCAGIVASDHSMVATAVLEGLAELGSAIPEQIRDAVTTLREQASSSPHRGVREAASVLRERCSSS